MRRACLFLSIALCLAGPAAAQTLWGIGFVGDNGPATLYTVSTLTGAATPVGAVGFERCSGMDFDAAGVLYAACERNDGSNTPVLVTVNTTTGAGTEVGPTGFGGAVGDLSLRLSDGVLFAYDANNDPDHTLFTIDTATGAGTIVGDTGLSFAGGNGMTFDLGGTLYHSQFSGGPSPDLNTLNPASGLPTFIGQITPTTARFRAMDVNPTTGVIFGVLNSGSGGGGPTELATIDPAGPTDTVIGTTEPSLDAIAFQPVLGPPSVLDIPTLDVAGLALLGLAMAGLGWVAIRARG